MLRSRIEALTDALTGLGNRRALMDDLARSPRGSPPPRPRALVLFDLDGFKRYNDTFGHPAGDVLLARLGGSLGARSGPTAGPTGWAATSSACWSTRRRRVARR